MGQIAQAQLVKAGEKFVVMLSPKQAEHPFADDLSSLLCGHHQLQTKKVLVVKMSLYLNRRCDS